MPSGSKKRKAARRKKEIVDGSQSPSSPTSSNPLQGEDHRANSGATSGDEEAAVAPVDGPVRAQDGEDKVEKEVASTPASEEPPHGVVEDLPIHVDKLEPPASEGAPEAGVVEDLSAPRASEGAPEAGVVEDLSAPPASEGAPEAGFVEDLSALRASEGAPEAGVVEDLSAPPASEGALKAGLVEDLSAPAADVPPDAASSSHETKEKSAPLLNTSERGMTYDSSEIPATQTEKRATWWNCCELLDLITRS